MAYPSWSLRWRKLGWRARTALWAALTLPPLALTDAAAGAAWFAHEAVSVAWAARCCCGPRAARRWQQLALGSLLLGDFAYALRQPATPRYPYNYLPDCAFVLAFVGLAALLLGRPRRLRLATAVGACAAAALQADFVLAPMGALACVPRGACVLALAYSTATAVVTSLCLELCLRLRSRRAVVAVHGPLLMLAADFVCRHAALSARAADVSWGEMGWALGLGLWVAPLASPPRRPRWPLAPATAKASRRPLAPWLSVRVLLAALIGATLPIAAALAVATGTLRVDDGRRLGALLAACWAALLVANVLAQQASGALHRTASRRVTGRFAAARLHELRSVLESRARDARWGQLAAETAHDLAGPAAALEAAAGYLARTGGHFGPLLRQASRRVRVLSGLLLQARRRAIGGPLRLGAAPTPPVQDLQPALALVRGRAGEPMHRRRGPTAGLQRGAQGPAAARSVRLVPLVRLALREAALRAGIERAAPVLRLGTSATKRQSVASAGTLVEARGPGPTKLGRAANGLCIAARRDAWLQLRVTVPADALMAALGALLDNAIQAQAASSEAPGSPVRVEVTLRRRLAQVTVRNGGRKVPEALQAHLGRRPVASSKAGGNGLGVWRAARAARGWGGTLALRSVPHRGTLAALTLPLASARRGARCVVVDDDPLVRRALVLAARGSGKRLVACSSSVGCWRVLARLWRRSRVAAPGTLARRWATATVVAVDDGLLAGDDGRALRRRLRAAGLPYVRRLAGDKLAPLAAWGKAAAAKRGPTKVGRPRPQATGARALREGSAHRPRGHEDLI